MPNKILNTNIGLGFQRHRKYDTDMDRLGRMKTAQSELRKTKELNLQSEMKKLKKETNLYSIKRFSQIPYEVIMTERDFKLFSEVLQKAYGMGDVVGAIGNGVRDVAGNVVEGAGKVVGSGAGQLAGNVGGFIGGGKLGAALGGAALGPLGAIGGAVLGSIIGTKAGGAGARTLGQTLQNVGQDIHS